MHDTDGKRREINVHTHPYSHLSTNKIENLGIMTLGLHSN